MKRYSKRIPSQLLRDLPAHRYFPDTYRRNVFLFRQNKNRRMLENSIRDLVWQNKPAATIHLMCEFAIKPSMFVDEILSAGNMKLVLWLDSIGIMSLYASSSMFIPSIAYGHWDVLDWLYEHFHDWVQENMADIAGASIDAYRWCYKRGYDRNDKRTRKSAILISAATGSMDHGFIYELGGTGYTVPELVQFIERVNVDIDGSYFPYWNHTLREILKHMREPISMAEFEQSLSRDRWRRDWDIVTNITKEINAEDQE